MNTTDYIAEAEGQVNNPDHYDKLQGDPTQKFNTHIRNLINQAWRLNIIDDTTYINLHTKNPRIPTFYLLPKIHKHNNPGRPTVNGTGSVTEKFSAYVDTFLRRSVPRIRSYIKDTTHILTILKHLEIQNTDLLVTIDVKSLCTNIPHTEGIAAIAKMMEDTGLDTLHRMLICNLAHHVLTKNYFIFNNQLYIQKQGIAMGTRMAPNYTVIFMHYLESNLLSSTTSKPKTWLRFIYDIFMIWPHGIQSLKQFINVINSYHPTIKFTYDYHKHEIPFLDTIVYKTEENQLFTRDYHKPTDNKQYLHYHSAHSRKQKESVPYGLLIRSKRICSEQKYFEHEARNILQQLKYRKYLQHLPDEAYRKVNNMRRQDLLQPSTHGENTKLRLIWGPGCHLFELLNSSLIPCLNPWC